MISKTILFLPVSGPKGSGDHGGWLPDDSRPEKIPDNDLSGEIRLDGRHAFIHGGSPA